MSNVQPDAMSPESEPEEDALNVNLTVNANNDAFYPTEEIKPKNWLVKGLVALGNVTVVAAQPGAGKSYWAEAMAIAVQYGQPFCGFDTVAGDVLIIDQDTPLDVLQERLTRFTRFFKNSDSPKHSLYRKSMKEYSMTNGSLTNAVLQYPKAKLLILDCLSRLVGKANMDRTQDMGCLATFRRAIDRPDLAVVLIHHISVKGKRMSIAEIAGNDNPQGLLMNNTQIVAVSDAIFLFGSDDIDGNLSHILVRPISRRYRIPVKMHMVELVESDDNAHFVYSAPVNPQTQLTEREQLALNLFEIGEEQTVMGVVKISGGEFGLDMSTRTLLHSLADKGYLNLKRRIGKGGRIVYQRMR